MFIAADTSAVVQANPVIIAYPGSGSTSSASAMRCDNSAAIAANRWAISADSCCRLASISVIKAPGVASSNILTACLLEWTNSLEFAKCVAGQRLNARLFGAKVRCGAADEVSERVGVGVDALLQQPVEEHSAGL